MDLQSALRQRLLAAAPISALTQVVSWGEVPATAQLPYIRLAQLGMDRDWTHTGPDGLLRPRVRIDVFATSNLTATVLGDAVLGELERIDPVEVGEAWRFEPPALLELDRGPDIEDVPGGVTANCRLLNVSFWVRRL